MTIEKLIEENIFSVVCKGNNLNRELTIPFCCDLLSIAMSKAPESGVWITVMGNMNTIAVASLTDVGCIVLAENAQLDEASTQKATTEGITVLKTELPIFDAALKVYNLITK